MGDSSDSESDRGGGGGGAPPGGGASAGGSSRDASSSGAGRSGGSAGGSTSQPPSQGHPGTGSFAPSTAADGGAVAAAALRLERTAEKSHASCRRKGQQSSRFFDVLIVGGGVAGLAGALHCQRAGVDYQVIEARDRLGGRVWSIRLPASAEERRRRSLGSKEKAPYCKEEKERKSGSNSVWIDVGANYMHGLTGNENDVRLKPRRRGCSVYHLAAASRACRVALVPGETGWENPYYFDWLRRGRRFCLLVVSLAHALFTRLATPVSLTAGAQPRGSTASILTLLNKEVDALLESEAALSLQEGETAAERMPPNALPACERHSRQPGSDLGQLPRHSTFESLAMPSALRGLVATLLRRLKDLCCSSAALGGTKSSKNPEIAIGECCACQVEGMVVRMLRSRFGFFAPLGDVSAAPFAVYGTPALKRDVQRLHNPKTRLLAWPGLRRYAENLSLAFAERDRKKSQVVRQFAAIPPSVSSDLDTRRACSVACSICMSWRWLVEMLREELSPDRLRLNTRVSFVSVSFEEKDSAFPCLVRCHTDDNGKEAQELRSRFVLVALPVSLLQQPPEGAEETAAHVTFEPPLAAEKVAALASIGMGVHNKVGAPRDRRALCA
ncbi:hypothetical protein cyc_00902 [Cyclospora cayetanensis]|uniref:Amine oxidase domain-containing protein n=1 Tax=Cyclospora cayetanensis TaxID=88456 RepID=A0A1D3D2J6_9EIME|nr:hypothetical protein cyc_00902 [Cyclospora cayetanensis]